MSTWQIPSLAVLASLGVLLLVMPYAAAEPTLTPTSSVEDVEKTTVQTVSYSIELWIGPMVAPMTASPTMSMMDLGQPVNRHLEVHIYDKSSGARVTDVVPTVTITDGETGAFRGLPDVLACMTSEHNEPHFGDNLYLSEGDYSVTVNLSNETAVFENIVVKGAR